MSGYSRLPSTNWYELDVRVGPWSATEFDNNSKLLYAVYFNVSVTTIRHTLWKRAQTDFQNKIREGDVTECSFSLNNNALNMKEFSDQKGYENGRLAEIQAALFHPRSLPTAPPRSSPLMNWS